jgi:hypothetical protein
MSYQQKPKPKWLIAERKGNHPIRVTHLRFRTKKKAEKMAQNLNKQCVGSDLRFLVRTQGWRRKRGYS